MTLTSVKDISERHRRSRQQAVVDLLEKYRAQADAGEIVGALVFYIQRDGTFGYGRDLFEADMAKLIGQLYIYLSKLAADYVDRNEVPEKLPPTEPA